MLRTILIYGTIGGLVVGLLMTLSINMVRGTPAEAHGMAIGYLTMLIALSTVFIAIKRRRDIEQGGVIRFWPALLLGLGISLIASLLYAVAWEINLAFMPGDFMGEMIAKMIEAEKAKGASGEALARMVAEWEQFRRDYDGSRVYRMSISMTEILPVGVLVSFVSAGLLCNSRFLPARRTPAPVT